MPFKKGYKKRYTKIVKKPSNKKMASACKKVNILFKSMETKFFDTQFNFANLDNGASTSNFLINPVPQGQTDQQRIGDKMYCTFLRFRASLRMDDASIVLTQRTRIIIIWDKSNTNPTLATILAQATTSSAPESAIFWDARKSWISLHDKTYITRANRRAVDIDFYTRIRKATQFDAGTININTGAIRIFMLANATLLEMTLNKPNILGNIRLHYMDN